MKRCPHVLRGQFPGVYRGRLECHDCHFKRLARERRIREWVDRWGPGLLLMVSVAALIVGAALGGAALRLR